MNRFSFFTALALMTGMAFAQAEPGVPQAADVMVVELDPGGKVDTLIQDFLARRAWVIGENVKEDDGSPFIVVKGVGNISAPMTHAGYNNSRVMAFKKAMLDAKAALARFLESAVSTAAEFRVTGRDPEEPTTQDQLAMALAKTSDDSICGKCVMLIHKKLDNALQKEGYDINSKREDVNALKAKLDSAINSESMKDAYAITSSTLASGLQAFYTAEADGMIGVVAIWSPALAEMASSMVTGQSVANKSPKKPIKQQIPLDVTTLISTFGVQQKINENGELVLVSFAQHAPKSGSKTSKRNAMNRAADEALVQIRQFAGEAVVTSNNAETAEETMEFTDGSVPDYKSLDAYERFQKSAGAPLKIEGVATIHSWGAVHPVSKKPVYGVVCTWSPSSAAQARKHKAMIEESAKKGAMGNRTIAPVAKKRTTAVQPGPKIEEDQFINSGAAGDDDAF